MTMPRKPNKADMKVLGLQAMIGMSASQIVEGIERAAVSEVESETTELPTDISKEGVAILKGWGVKFIGPKPDDDVFQLVNLPKGWTFKRHGDNGYHFALRDQNGRTRGSMFYKAAFYDRSANMYVCRRLQACSEYGEDGTDQEGKKFGAIKDSNGKILWRGTVVARDLLEKDPAREEAEKVLKEAYPNSDDFNALWDVSEFNFPPDRSAKPRGDIYKLWVGLYHGTGHSKTHVDSGMNTRVRAISDESGIKKLKEKAKWFTKNYETVEIIIYRVVLDKNGEEVGEVKVHKETIEKPEERAVQYCFGPDGEYAVCKDGRRVRIRRGWDYHE